MTEPTSPPAALPLDRPGAEPAPFLTVVMRTQGRRPRLLAEALVSLSVQSDLDVELCLVRHAADHGATRRDATGETSADGEAAAVAEVVAAAPSAVAARTRCLVAPPGRRGVPLNVGIDAARGRYVAFLDDDDRARPDWVRTFRLGAEQAPGQLIRARALAQDVALGADGEQLDVRSEPTARYAAAFDLLDHLAENRTPICTVAWPVELFRGPDAIRVDEELVALEDWDLLLQAAVRAEVHDIAVPTSVVRMWTDAGGSKEGEGAQGWEEARSRVLARLVERPWPALSRAHRQVLVDAAGELSECRRFAAELAADPLGTTGDRPLTTAERMRGEFEGLHRKAAALVEQIGELNRALAEADRAAAELAAIRRSTSWRITGPLRALRARTGDGAR